MTTTRVFKSGNSQAVRLPKEFSVDSKVLEIFRRGDEIVLRKPAKGLARAFELLTNLQRIFLLKAAVIRRHSTARDCDAHSLSVGYQHLYLHST